jgi:hypothetical protein
MATDHSIRSPFARRAQLMRRVSAIAQALRLAADACPHRDYGFKSRLRTASTACQQLAADLRRQDGAA